MPSHLLSSIIKQLLLALPTTAHTRKNIEQPNPITTRPIGIASDTTVPDMRLSICYAPEVLPGNILLSFL
ncbi:MAG: hypothetical protein NC038_07210 [Paludibacter sp.]|nr:hypothetical protein [Prevotella sp.]MCM1354742.1 hypothetical protein [Bacteroides sp.]MCM1442151.1 hypothetical protein [Muribaculum sp.]MCM1482406.1 hypothetical protein [Paludibacter sp.]